MDREYIGFASLPDQIHRKTIKKGFEFTLMVAGETGLGKSTLINTLFLTDLYQDRVVPPVQGNTNSPAPPPQLSGDAGRWELGVTIHHENLTASIISISLPILFCGA